jgi:hypothetical protein
MRRTLVGALVLFACGARTPVRTTPYADGGAEAPPCDYGTVTADPFGQVVFFNGGKPIPPGHYRLTYLDGCMRYSASEGWTVNDDATSPAFWLVNGSPENKIVLMPGTVGSVVGQGGFATFQECIAGQSSDAPVDLDVAGGALGVWLEDDLYNDNVPGDSGRNPKWRLSCP